MKIFRHFIILLIIVFPLLSNAQIVLNASTEEGSPGQEVCVKVSVENFTNILTFQLSHNFDPAVLEFKEIRNFIFESASTPIELTFGVQDVDEGIITMSWNSSDFVNGSSVADETVLYEICFTVVGTEGQFSDFTFEDEPRTIEIANIDNEVLAATINNGRVNIGEVVVGDGLVIAAQDVVANTGTQVCVPINVTNFDNMISVQHSIQFDPTYLEFVEVQNFVFNSNIALTFGTQDADEGTITFLWTASDPVNGTSVNDGTTIYELCFNAVGECETNTVLDLTDTPLELEASNTQETIDATLTDGTVTMGSCTYSVVVSSSSNPCNGMTNGSIDISVFGGSPSYTYLWSNGSTDEDLTGLGPGTYNVTVTDSDGTEITLDQGVVLNDDPIIIDPIISDPSESGATDGSISVSVDNGTPEYSYQWDNGAQTPTRTNLGEGTYGVTVTDANGCTASAEITLSLGLKVVSADINQISCAGENDGAIDITVGGGESPYSFSWSNDATDEDLSGLGSGSYSVTITDNQGNMAVEGPYEITEPNPISIETDVTDVSDGGDGAIDLTVSGGQPSYTFSWSNGATTEDISDLESGTYSVTITDANGCEVAFEVEVPLEMFRVEFNVTDLDCNGDNNGSISASPQNGSSPFTYNWSNGETTQTITGLPAGEYEVTVADSDGNMINSTVTVEEPPVIEVTTDESGTGVSDRCVDAIVQGGVAPYTFDWQPINQSTARVCNLEEGQELVLVVTDDNGCQVIQNVVVTPPGVECYDGLTVISPNGDGMNDNLVIACALQNVNNLKIFDRWGQMVYEEDNYSNNWSGTDLSGQELPDGAYYWVLTVTLSNNDQRVYKNSVTLVRKLN